MINQSVKKLETKLAYMDDAYLKELKSHVLNIAEKGKLREIILDSTIFYPEGGGQPPDKGDIIGESGIAKIKHVQLEGSVVKHQCTIQGEIKVGEIVLCKINWSYRYRNMRYHTGGHIIHDAIMQIYPNLKPIRGSHSKKAFIEYQGVLKKDMRQEIEVISNKLVEENLEVITKVVTYDELVKECSFVPQNLPRNKPLRIVAISGFEPIPCGGTHVKYTNEVGKVRITEIKEAQGKILIGYKVEVTKAD
jgi:Ser-tRNA(Ala) deacylase AlaX